MQNLNEKVVFITGGSEGYGKATAEHFYNEGAKVIIAARNEIKLEYAKCEIGQIDTLQMDVTKSEDWKMAKEYIETKYGGIDILINNAGGGVHIKETTQLSVEEIDKIIKLNLNSVIYGCREFAPLMKEKQEGTIINLSSVCAKYAWPAWSVYAAAKAGVLNFSKVLYTELQKDNIRVTCVIPAAASTGFQKGSGIDEVKLRLQADDIAQTILNICKMPQHVFTQEITVWGNDQVVNPL